MTIEAHYARVWAPALAQHRWDRGPIDELPADFRVLVIPHTRGVLAYATAGMSQPGDADPIELHLLVRAGPVRADLVELLTVVAHYHRTGHRLGLGHTVNFGRPWSEGSRCTHGLISLPYLDGPILERPPDSDVRCLWLIPVTAAEVEYKKKEGLDALEARFEAMPLDAMDPLRPSAA